MRKDHAFRHGHGESPSGAAAWPVGTILSVTINSAKRRRRVGQFRHFYGSEARAALAKIETSDAFPAAGEDDVTHAFPEMMER
jgi:hypothetical protein